MSIDIFLENYQRKQKHWLKLIQSKFVRLVFGTGVWAARGRCASPVRVPAGMFRFSSCCWAAAGDCWCTWVPATLVGSLDRSDLAPGFSLGRPRGGGHLGSKPVNGKPFSLSLSLFLFCLSNKMKICFLIQKQKDLCWRVSLGIPGYSHLRIITCNPIFKSMCPCQKLNQKIQAFIAPHLLFFFAVITKKIIMQ